jgi:hypothetical protein
LELTNETVNQQPVCRSSQQHNQALHLLGYDTTLPSPSTDLELLKVQATHSFKTMETTYPMTLHHIPEDQNRPYSNQFFVKYLSLKVM